MFLDAVVRLYDYQREMNDRVLDVAQQISRDDLTAVLIEGQPSIRDTLFHIFDVIESHFSWWNYAADRQVPTAEELSTGDFTSVGDLRNLSQAVNNRVDTCIRSLESDADLELPYERGFTDGSSNKRVRWEMLLHVINHGTQHRSEVAIMLTSLGHSPGDMEIL